MCVYMFPWLLPQLHGAQLVCRATVFRVPGQAVQRAGVTRRFDADEIGEVGIWASVVGRPLKPWP